MLMDSQDHAEGYHEGEVTFRRTLDGTRFGGWGSLGMVSIMPPRAQSGRRWPMRLGVFGHRGASSLQRKLHPRAQASSPLSMRATELVQEFRTRTGRRLTCHDLTLGCGARVRRDMMPSTTKGGDQVVVTKPPSSLLSTSRTLAVEGSSPNASSAAPKGGARWSPGRHCDLPGGVRCWR